MKTIIRTKISLIASYIEILLSIILMLGMFYGIYQIIIKYLVETITFDYSVFLADILQIIISIEFIKMLSKHTPGSTIEVLVFAVARKIIIEEFTSFDLLLGVAAIAALFAVRKYLCYRIDVPTSKPNIQDSLEDKS